MLLLDLHVTVLDTMCQHEQHCHCHPVTGSYCLKAGATWGFSGNRMLKKIKQKKGTELSERINNDKTAEY